jgi:PPP family 3-phenylpropionic acid transporter
MRTSHKLALFYAALLLGGGVATPYIAVWLKARGLSGAEIGIILSAPLMVRIVTGPGIAVWADTFRLRRTAIALLLALSAVVSAAMMAAHGFWLWLILWFAAASTFTACSPLADVIVMRSAAQEGFTYARPRSVGSAAYIVGNIAGGALIAALGPQVVIVWIILCGLLAAATARWLLPPMPVRHDAAAKARKRDLFAGVGRLAKDKLFMLTIVSVGLIQAAHAFYYGFSALVWKGQGISSAITGLLWGVGVAVEVIFLWFGEPWRRRMGPERLLILGGAGSVARWTAFALSPPVWLLFPLQALHALSFTCTFIGSLHLVERLSPPESASSAQMMNSALSGGLLIGLATLASGALYDHVGAYGYLAMSLLAAVGLIGAWRLARIVQTASSRRR